MHELVFSTRTTLPSRTPDVLDRNKALLDTAEGYVYKSADGNDLGAYVFRPEGSPPPSGWPSALFFFSSTWDTGLLSQFAPHALYLASRGMVGVLIDYRVAYRHPGASPLDAMQDARSAIRWAREHAAELKFDPSRIVGIGGSAGAHAILSAAMLRRFLEADGENTAVPCAPNALILFSPVTDTSRNSGAGFDRFPDKSAARHADLIAAVRSRLPPMLIFHGTADRVVPFANSRKFRRRNWWHRNLCRLRPFEGKGHGFFNFNVSVRVYELTLSEIDAFLVELGFLPTNPDDNGVPRLG
jgi:acetyl esterase/lipase